MSSMLKTPTRTFSSTFIYTAIERDVKANERGGRFIKCASVRFKRSTCHLYMKVISRSLAYSRKAMHFSCIFCWRSATVESPSFSVAVRYVTRARTSNSTFNKHYNNLVAFSWVDMCASLFLYCVKCHSRNVWYAEIANLRTYTSNYLRLVFKFNLSTRVLHLSKVNMENSLVQLNWSLSSRVSKNFTASSYFDF